jgi:hypothetical protein
MPVFLTGQSDMLQTLLIILVFPYYLGETKCASRESPEITQTKNCSDVEGQIVLNALSLSEVEF